SMVGDERWSWLATPDRDEARLLVAVTGAIATLGSGDEGMGGRGDSEPSASTLLIARPGAATDGWTVARMVLRMYLTGMSPGRMMWVYSLTGSLSTSPSLLALNTTCRLLRVNPTLSRACGVKLC